MMRRKERQLLKSYRRIIKSKKLSILCGLDVHVSLKNIETEKKEEKLMNQENLKTQNMEKTEQKENIDLDFLRKYECIDNLILQKKT